MVQILPPRRNIGSQIGEAIGGGLQQGISGALQNRLAQEQAKLQSQFAQEQAKLQSQLGTESALQKALFQHQLSSQQGNLMKEKLLKLGIPEDIASLYSTATEGGKTAILNNLLDLEQRGLIPGGLFSKLQESGEIPGKSAEIPQKLAGNSEETRFQFPKISAEKGLKPSEFVGRENKREQTNIPFYNEANAKLRNYEKEGMALRRLTQLNQSGKLPTGLEKWNVDWNTGELRVPALATPEAQLFVKTINDFTTKAKDSYGARVTNFELDRFLKRLPTLANSPQGRELILQQMNVINELDKLEEESLLAAYDHYGIGRINAQQAGKYAREAREKEEKLLSNRFNSLEGILDNLEESKFDLSEKPDAAAYTGKIIEDEQGNQFRSDGKNWKRI